MWRFIGFSLVIACGSDDAPPALDASGMRDSGTIRRDGGSSDAGRSDGGVIARDAGRDGGSPGSDAGADADVPMPVIGSCSDAPPPGAELPDPIPSYSGGSCPMIAPGRNTIRSGGADREFLFVAPESYDASGSDRLPVIFMWHWLGGDAEGFLERGQVQEAADAMNFLAVIPEEKGDLLLRWPYLIIDPDGRVEEEAVFFDDMLACVAEHYRVNESCVSSAGVSAGALWTSQLAQLRATHIANFLSLSGGVGTPGDLLTPIRPWTGAEHHMPAFVLWGGPTDFCGLNFQTASTNLEAGLEADGHFIVECVHDCSHAEPPLAPAPAGMSSFAPVWQFALDHPYWLADGVSPYTIAGLPAGTPEWCAIGAGSATFRDGECEGGVLGSCI
jgi:predicted esterase